MERVILVDENDVAIGSAEKLQAHVDGKLHRAFSIFVFDAQGRTLLQRRAGSKYHSGGLWSNTCCGHPRPGEATQAAAARRLMEEMNFGCELRESFVFVYRAELEGALVEHELDHVLVGEFDGEPTPEAAEVEDWKWISPEHLRREIQARPDDFTSWLKIAIAKKEWEQINATLKTKQDTATSPAASRD